jgi:hypothetical protein
MGVHTFVRWEFLRPACRGKPMITALLQLAGGGRAACMRALPPWTETQAPAAAKSCRFHTHGHGRTYYATKQTLARLLFTQRSFGGSNGALFDPVDRDRARRPPRTGVAHYARFLL